jgi:hypothetical protein
MGPPPPTRATAKNFVLPLMYLSTRRRRRRSGRDESEDKARIQKLTKKKNATRNMAALVSGCASLHNGKFAKAQSARNYLGGTYDCSPVAVERRKFWKVSSTLGASTKTWRYCKYRSTQVERTEK